MLSQYKTKDVHWGCFSSQLPAYLLMPSICIAHVFFAKALSAALLSLCCRSVGTIFTKFTTLHLWTRWNHLKWVLLRIWYNWLLICAGKQFHLLLQRAAKLHQRHLPAGGGSVAESAPPARNKHPWIAHSCRWAAQNQRHPARQQRKPARPDGLPRSENFHLVQMKCSADMKALPEPGSED